MTPETHKLVCTAKDDGRVGVFTPFKWAMAYMTGGGGMWDDRPRGFLEELVRRKTCPVLQKGNPTSEEGARRFVQAAQWGGLSTQEAWDVIRVHDCERWGHSVQVQRLDELPPDRWFRDAWVRGGNSGYVFVDMALARPIQWSRVICAYETENKRREKMFRGPKLVKLPKISLERAIANARDADELRRVFPCFS